MVSFNKGKKECATEMLIRQQEYYKVRKRPVSLCGLEQITEVMFNWILKAVGRVRCAKAELKL